MRPGTVLFLAIIDNRTTQADGSGLSDGLTTALGEQREISPGELPGDRNAADRLCWQFKQLCKPRSIDQKGEFADDCVGTDYEPVVPSTADQRGKIECRRWGHPAKFGRLLAPERNCQFGVAKFPDQPGFGPAGVGYTIASSRAGAKSIWLSHGRNPGRVCYISQ
jgi:hypothetical protein